MCRQVGHIRTRTATPRRMAVIVAILLATQPATAILATQPTSQSTIPPSHLPEPILWKQSRFMIPYQWSAGADHSSAESVRLYISKDRGRSWQEISRAAPNLRGFTYHAEQDGEFWFSIRTFDNLGRAWPQEPHQPELRVIVDTTIPEITELRGELAEDSSLSIFWSIRDAHFDPAGLKIQVRPDGESHWLPVTIPPSQLHATGSSHGQLTWQVPRDVGSVAIRAEVYDLAGNRNFRGTEVGTRRTRRTLPSSPSSTASAGGDQALPETPHQNLPAGPHAAAFSSRRRAVSAPLQDPFGANPDLANPRPDTAHGAQNHAPSVPSQPWPANAATTRGHTTQTPAPRSQPSSPVGQLGDNTSTPRGRLNEGWAGESAEPPPPAGLARDGTGVGSHDDRANISQFGPVAPFRPISHGRPEASPQRSLRSEEAAASTADEVSSPTTAMDGQTAETWHDAERPDWLSRFGAALPPHSRPLMVGSRTFDLDYSLESVGSWGVSRVELWGTRDGGKTWRSYALDDDNRSPLRVTVEGEGVYGFRIVAHGSGGVVAEHPQPGDEPELWVGVDLQRPEAELLAVQQGTGNLSDHLVFRWRATDDNLDSRPIALFYSSRPVGPWSAVATGLENTGQYAWRLERHLPQRFYLRLEVRDTAGNLTSYQTSSPIVLDRPQPKGQLRGVRPPGISAGVREPVAR